MDSKARRDFYDLCYDVWCSGGNPDNVDLDRFEDLHESEYDFCYDTHKLRREMKFH